MSPSSTPTPPPGARLIPPLIGIQLYAQTLPSSLPSDRFDATIMHRVVPPVLQHITVSLDASVCDIAATFSLPVSFVAANWLTSRTPIAIPAQRNSAPLRRQPLSPAQLDAHRQLAVAVARKLEAYVVPSDAVVEKPPRPSRARIERLHAQAMAAIVQSTSPATGTASNASPVKSVSVQPVQEPQKSQKRTKERCAFSPRNTHQDLELAPMRNVVSKFNHCLYRCARSAVPLNTACNYYVEFDVLANSGNTGLTIGLTSADAPLNALLGSFPQSLGFHSSGHLVVSPGKWIPYANVYGAGDTVSMLIEMPMQPSTHASSADTSTESLSAPSNLPQSSSNLSTNTTQSGNQAVPRVTFFINGQSQGLIPRAQATFLAQNIGIEQSFYTAVSLYHHGSSVQMKCCASEWQYFPAASALCLALRPTCHRKIVAGGNQTTSNTIRAKQFAACESMLTP